MSVFINGTGVISAQQTFDKNVLKNGFINFKGNRWPCHEPDYSQFIDGKQIRRMSRIIRMGIVSSLLATREAGVQKPDAIIVGTAFGCLEDTYAFLSKLVQYKEEMLSPTAFIHSTHNTIAAQIALLFQCHGYNSTYVHRVLSFESAFTDAILLLEEGTASNILVGGIDEITNAGFTIMDRLGFFKDSAAIMENNFYENSGKGSAAGEGSAFFSLSNARTNTTYAEVAGIETYSFMTPDEVISKAGELLAAHGISQPDILISGHNGDSANDASCDYFASGLKCTDRILKYKHRCGEYATASAFATWLAAEILKENRLPGLLNKHLMIDKPAAHILIYNQQDNLHHSLMLLRSC